MKKANKSVKSAAPKGSAKRGCEQVCAQPVRLEWSKETQTLFTANQRELRRVIRNDVDLRGLERIFHYAKTANQREHLWLTEQKARLMTPFGRLVAAACDQARLGVHWEQLKLGIEEALWPK